MSTVWQGYVRLQAGEGRKFRVAPGGKAVLADETGVRRLPEEGEAAVAAKPEGADIPVSVYPDPTYLEWNADGEWVSVPPERLRLAGGQT